MIQYIDEIVCPYVTRVREILGDHKSALVVMDNFTGQITDSVNTLLDANDIHVCLLPPNTTDRLQPLDVSVNKLAKDFLKNKFEEWYSAQVTQQLAEHDTEDLSSVPLSPIDLSLAALKEIGAKWLVEMVQYLRMNPDIIVNGFIRTGIADALDAHMQRRRNKG